MIANPLHKQAKPACRIVSVQRCILDPEQHVSFFRSNNDGSFAAARENQAAQQFNLNRINAIGPDSAVDAGWPFATDNRLFNLRNGVIFKVIGRIFGAFEYSNEQFKFSKRCNAAVFVNAGVQPFGGGIINKALRRTLINQIIFDRFDEKICPDRGMAGQLIVERKQRINDGCRKRFIRPHRIAQAHHIAFAHSTSARQTRQQFGQLFVHHRHLLKQS